MTTGETKQPSVLIVGGGLGGIATAVALAERGVSCRLLESKPRLGGRAGSFEDPETKSLVDNCQHVGMGCCTNLKHLLRTVGIESSFRREKVLYFVGVDGRVSRLYATPGPSPLHLAWAGFWMRSLSFTDKLRVVAGLRRLARPLSPAAADQSFARWLYHQGQTPSVIAAFWEVVLVSALSETLDRMTVGAARKVFLDGFLRHRDSWIVEIPDAKLGEIYGEPVIQWLKARGGEVLLRSSIEKVLVEGQRVSGVRLKDGKTMTADHYVLAVPWHRLGSLLPDSWKDRSPFAEASRLEAAPITSVHIWLDRPITDLPHAVFLGRLSQWLFNRTQLEAANNGAHEGIGGWYYQVVISASRNLAGHSQREILRRVLVELAGVFPAARAAVVIKSRQITEHRAVFSVQPGSDRCRPTQATGIENLVLAGDWTQTGWPATMEGAVRGGNLAAEQIFKRLERSERCVAEELPISRLATWLFPGLGVETTPAAPPPWTWPEEVAASNTELDGSAETSQRPSAKVS